MGRLEKKMSKLGAALLRPGIGIGALILVVLLSMLIGLQWRGESRLEIRTIDRGTTVPDGFFVWRYLNDQGIPLKSITPRRNGLILSCSTVTQCQAAHDALQRSLPPGYVLALQEKRSLSSLFLARLRSASHKLG